MRDFYFQKQRILKKYSYRFKLLSKTTFVVPHKMQGLVSLPIFLSFFFSWGNKDYENRKKGRGIGKLGEICEVS